MRIEAMRQLGIFCFTVDLSDKPEVGHDAKARVVHLHPQLGPLADGGGIDARFAR
jgi:hypothetical protein